uniref:Acetylserotonin O-methyltransferase n=1 Tax=Scleropages formosus TaxID=113540 RepID=A0A8C9TDL3_SCLFO
QGTESHLYYHLLNGLTLFAACELGVFDFLLASERPMSAAQVAAGLGTDVDGMERLLSACAGLELLGTQAAGGEVLYSNTDMSRMYLSRSSPRSLFHSVEYYSKTVYLCWNYLTDAVREGKNQYEKAFGLPSEDLFEALYRSDDEMIKFMQLMNSTWNVCGRDVMTAFDLSPFKTIYDLGGCSGALAKQCVRAYPQSSVTIFDLPKVVSTCREHFVSPTDERIFFHEGITSFPPNGNLGHHWVPYGPKGGAGAASSASVKRCNGTTN